MTVIDSLLPWVHLGSREKLDHQPAWSKQGSNRKQLCFFLQPLHSDLPDQTALLYALTYLNDAVSFPSLPVLRTSLIWSLRLTLKPGPVKTEISAPRHPLPFHTSSTSTRSSSEAGAGKGGWCKVDKGATRSVLLWCSVDASGEPPSQAWKEKPKPQAHFMIPLKFSSSLPRDWKWLLVEAHKAGLAPLSRCCRDLASSNSLGIYHPFIIGSGPLAEFFKTAEVSFSIRWVLKLPLTNC